ncbi:DUF1292 domain-containing protein [Priestia taiwanensis]|uniref:DUF1292 domain-containing protein n=1 Tax=Priestia taiwanensis TaxID=1347902 RepID=A0A917AKB5_9BACI|nr:DUF1292 domain-containing protein [Priestia taiwanensis]MBM7361829.1 hypothetical protein [Priestia taiwanensis]GGE57280.1 hypothetical protein GCM10007140_04540 [Priestia taiwanensis]
MEKIAVGEVFATTDETEQEQEIEVFFRVEDGGLSYIESDEEFDKVSTSFDRMMDEQVYE